MNDLESCLALLAASYTVPEVIVTRNDPNYVHIPRKPKADPKAKVVQAKDSPAIFGVVMPEMGSLDAMGFTLAMRNAGKRPFTAHNAAGEPIQVIKVEAKQVRPDCIKAIHAYCGYDPKGEFGTQEQAARAKASIEIGYRKTNGLTRQESRTHAAGQPEQRKQWGVDKDPQAARLAHLRSSETTIVENILSAEKAAKEAHAMACEARAEEQLEFAEACAEVAGKAQATVVIERARLAQVQADLKAIKAGKVTFSRA
jgi:hypothetical protein